MKKICCALFFIFAIGLPTSIWAASNTQGNYTLTVSQGNPPVTPSPARINNDITVQFLIAIVEKKNDREEDVSKKVKSCSYTVTVGGEQMVIKSVAGGFTIASDKLSAEKSRGAFLKKVSPVVQTAIPGEKSVTLAVSVTLEDDTVLSTSETITFVSPDFYFSVHVRGADNYNPTRLYLIDGSGRNGFIDVGHAAWKIGVSPREMPNLSTDQQGRANQQWGLGDNGTIDNAMYAFAQNHYLPTDKTPFVVGVPGVLRSGDQGTEVRRFALEDLDAAKTALDYITATVNNTPEYNVPNHNCVDQCLGALGNSGLPSPDCKGSVKLGFRYTRPSGAKRTKTWTIQLSIPKKLSENL